VNKAEVRGQKSEVKGRESLGLAFCRLPPAARGFSLIELVITISVLAILTLGTVPLVQVTVQRQKEQQLHEDLRMMREAIDQFHREALAGSQRQINQQTGQGQNQNQNQGQNQGQGGGQNNIFADPRVRVFITDQTIFTADNMDRYPPDLDTLVKGVSVLPVTTGGLGNRGNLNVTATQAATEESTIPKTKIYLRQIPVNPFTGEKDWEFRSCYDPADATSTGGENVFDVHFPASKDRNFKPLDGKSKYSEW
jgi:prepilin-type N-terminal cleavage/methylation domain-containing protein